MRPDHEPDFRELAKVLEKGTPDRPVLFEFMLGDKIVRRLCGERYSVRDRASFYRSQWLAYEKGGYDFASLHASTFQFPREPREPRKGVQNPSRIQTSSLNDGATIVDRATMDAYSWPDPADFSLEPFQDALKESPHGMQALVCSPCGILENVVGLTGYDNLCLMIHDDSLLASDLFEQVGSRILAYFRAALRIDRVGALMCNDDWGFNTQTMISPDHLRTYVFPWYQQIVKAAHDAGRYALLHSCGNSREILDDIIGSMAFDGKHSFEDNIEPVEDAYEALKGRIAVLGGIDIGFLTTATPERIAARCSRMLERTAVSGGYALGSGNSIADFVPFENYEAMVDTARRFP